MRHLILLLTFLFTLPVFAQTASKIPSTNFEPLSGAGAIDTRAKDNWVVVWGTQGANAGTGFVKTNDAGSSTMYGPSGVTYKIKAVEIQERGEGGCSLGLSYTDTSTGLTLDDAGIPGTQTWFANNAVGNVFYVTLNARRVFPVNFDVPTGNFPTMTIGSGTCDTSIFLWGVEE